VSPVKYELCFYIPEDDILHSHRRENLKSYNVETVTAPILRTLGVRTRSFEGKFLIEVWGKLEVNVKGDTVTRGCSISPSNNGLCPNCNPSLFAAHGVNMQNRFDIIMLGFPASPLHTLTNEDAINT
jgi:hypothetical protein